MKVLITGHLGFVGRHLHRAHEERGDTVIGVDVDGGQMDASQYFLSSFDTRFDVVHHCAAFVHGRSGIDGSAAYLHTNNTMLDAAMFRWALRTRPGRIVYFSSSAAYPLSLQQEKLDAEPLTERDINLRLLRPPEASYGRVKLHGEQMARDVINDDIPVTILRPFSGYGSDQTLAYPFPSFLARARAKEDPFTVWGDGTQVRDWIHIDDIVGATLAAVDQGVPGPVNLCTGRGTDFTTLATMMTTAAGYSPEFAYRTDKPSGVAYRVGDPKWMNEFYTAKITLEEGIDRGLASR